MNDGGYWTGIAAIIAAFLTGVAGPYIAARLHLKIKGITPEEAAQATNRAGFRNKVDETSKLAVRIAASAQEAATKAEQETAEVIEKNNVLLKENEVLRGRVAALELLVKQIPKLQRELKRLRQQVRNYQRPTRRKGRKP